MGYYNPIYSYGNQRFLADAKAAGVDGLIVVDLPPEADDELCIPAMHTASISFGWRRRRPTTGGFPPFSPILRGSFTTSRSSASPAPRRRTRRVTAAVERISGTPYCRWRSGSASGRRRRPAPSAGPPMAWSSVRHWSARSRFARRQRARHEETVAAVTDLVAELAEGVRAARLQAAE